MESKLKCMNKIKIYTSYICLPEQKSDQNDLIKEKSKVTMNKNVKEQCSFTPGRESVEPTLALQWVIEKCFNIRKKFIVRLLT